MIIADVQTPAQPTPVLSTVVPKKPQTPGEEQIRTKTHREASHKQFTTSEYSNLVNIAHVVKLPIQTKANQFVTLLLLLVPSNLFIKKKALFSPASDTADNGCYVCVTTAFQCMLGCTAVFSDTHIQSSAVEKQHPEQPH